MPPDQVRRPDDDAGVELAGERQVADVAPVVAAAAVFVVLDVGHGGGLGGAGEGAGVEAGDEGVEGRQAGGQPALHLRHRVHDAGVFLHESVVGNADPGLTDAADVVARQIDEHVELRLFLLRVQQRHHVVVVREAVAAARHGAGNGPLLHHAVLDPHEHLRRGADQRLVAVVDVELVRRRVDGAEAPVQLQRALGVFAGEAVRQDDLEELALAHLLARLVHRGHEGLAAGVRFQLVGDAMPLGGGRRRRRLQPGQAVAHHVGGRRGAAQEIVNGQRAALFQVVEEQQGVRHEQPEVLRRAGLQAVRQRLEQAHEIVGEGAVESEGAVPAAKVPQQGAHDLRDVVEEQALVLGHRAALAGYRAGDGVVAEPEIPAAGKPDAGERSAQQLPPARVQGADGEGILLALDQDGWIDHRQRVAAVDARHVHRLVQHARFPRVEVLVELKGGQVVVLEIKFQGQAPEAAGPVAVRQCLVDHRLSQEVVASLTRRHGWC